MVQILAVHSGNAQTLQLMERSETSSCGQMGQDQSATAGCKAYNFALQNQALTMVDLSSSAPVANQMHNAIFGGRQTQGAVQHGRAHIARANWACQAMLMMLQGNSKSLQHVMIQLANRSLCCANAFA